MKFTDLLLGFVGLVLAILAPVILATMFPR